jgi:hypothetical protein
MRIVLLLPILFFAGCSQKKNIPPGKPLAGQAKPSFACHYSANKLRCQQLYNACKTDPSPSKQNQLVNYLRDSVLPCWYGTKWDFNGTTEQPGQGTIACGYFITTVLRDAGIPINRFRIAKYASEKIVESTCQPTTIRRFRNVTLDSFTARTKRFGFGLYIVGLDNHVGFILNDSTESYFIHSTYVGQRCVIKEKANESSVLGNSSYRIIGRVL